MAKPQKARGKRPRPGRTMVTIPKERIYFKSGGDPEGSIPVDQKHREAEAMCNLLLVSIARSGTPLDLLDLPGSAESIRAHVTANPQPFHVFIPGDGMVEEAARCILMIRTTLYEEHKKAVAARIEAAAQAGRESQGNAESAAATVH